MNRQLATSFHVSRQDLEVLGLWIDGDDDVDPKRVQAIVKRLQSMATRRRLRPGQLAIVRPMYEAGASLEQCANRLGVAREWLAREMKHAGIAIQPGCEHWKKKRELGLPTSRPSAVA